jgi:Tfp pilus assembly protein PilP
MMKRYIFLTYLIAEHAAAAPVEVRAPASYIDPTTNIDNDLQDLEQPKSIAKKVEKTPEKNPLKSKTAGLGIVKNKIVIPEKKPQKKQEQRPTAVVAKTPQPMQDKTGKPVKVANVGGILQTVWDSVSTEPDVSREITQGIKVEDVVEQNSGYNYRSTRDDPFIPPILIKERAPSKPVTGIEIAIVSPLQMYSLSELKISGIWVSDDQLWKALVMTPKGEGIITKEGDPIGSGGGRIVAIRDEGIRAREFTIKRDGTREYKDTMMAITALEDAAVQNTGGSILINPGSDRAEFRQQRIDANQPASSSVPVVTEPIQNP